MSTDRLREEEDIDDAFETPPPRRPRPRPAKTSRKQR